MTVRHDEDRLGGVIEAALNRAMLDEEWLQDMAKDPSIDHGTSTGVFQGLESYITDHLARITAKEDLVIKTYYCPLCSEQAEVIQVDVQHGDIGDEDITWKRVHLECKGKCPLLWSCVDIPDECYDEED